ncbi:TIM-barrel domain-containing protein [Cohnella hashimotonis]|uniref:Glycoside hydrolase family 31 protein n=1 Tax=Cohnella hashimotonis TaxID=2826895 RepID=A0ABT6TKL7_9BACL|nr:TIM-barrel domain-containing protein [Cohnella hashimotonis]MDI4647264.1 glycoside hydrolase family 31 protein [Cohnella hashimotonis]
MNETMVGLGGQAFACYAWLLEGRIAEAKRWVRELSGDIGGGVNDTVDLALWLWCAGACRAAEGRHDEEAYPPAAVRLCIDRIRSGWDKEGRHWLLRKLVGIFTANIAVMYGAIDAIRPYAEDADLEPLLAEMRMYAFIYALREGEYVGLKGDPAMIGDMGDIALIAVPFKLVRMDDLYLERTIHTLEKRLSGHGVSFSRRRYPAEETERADLTLLLAWYYAEAGYEAYARRMLQSAATLRKSEPERSDLADALLSIVKCRLSAPMRKKRGTIVFHKPVGENDPYSSRNYERDPRHPEAGEPVWIRAHTIPFHADQHVCVIRHVEGEAPQEYPMRLAASPDGERYWEASIGSFQDGRRVNYEFEARFDNEIARSGSYGFDVLRWHRLRMTDVREDAAGLLVLFERAGSLRGIPCLRIKRHSAWSVRLSFALAEETIAGEAAASWIDADEADAADTAETAAKDSAKPDGGTTDTLARSLGSLARLFGGAADGEWADIALLAGRDGRARKLRIGFAKQGDESFFGTGERFSHLELSGREVDCSVYNKYKNHGLKTYLPVPMFVSSAGYGFYADTTAAVKLRFGSRKPDRTEAEVGWPEGAEQLSMYLFDGGPGETLREYAGLTGMPALPPKWCFGLWISSNSWDSERDVREQFALAKTHGVPVGAIILEQWSDEATFYIFNGAQYEVKSGEEAFRYADFAFDPAGKWPDPKRMVRELHEAGVRVLLWQAPYQMYFGSVSNAQRDADERTMLERDYHVRYRDGRPYRSHFYWFGHSLLPDFTNPKARDWWMEKREYLVSEIGIDGYKTDGGECILDEGLLFANGKTEEEMRNAYPNAFAEAYYRSVADRPGGGVTFSRAGCQGAQRLPVHWAGDDLSTFPAFRDAVRAGLSAGLSGIPFWGWDLGNFSGEIPNAELYIRSTQMSVFCPIVQLHSESMEKKTYDRTPWNVAERTGSRLALIQFKRYMDLRMNLVPYCYEQALASSATGLPMMRAMFLSHPEDPACARIWEQYMFGESLLVAPVLEEGATSKRLYLPKGDWMDFFSGETVSGGAMLEREAGIGQIPVYQRADSVVPLNLGDDGRLFGPVGNGMEGYRRLVFWVHLTDRLQYRFADDLGNEVCLEAALEGDKLSIRAEGAYGAGIVVVLNRIPGIGSGDVIVTGSVLVELLFNDGTLIKDEEDAG